MYVHNNYYVHTLVFIDIQDEYTMVWVNFMFEEVTWYKSLRCFNFVKGVSIQIYSNLEI